ncbi:DUF3794 domain-containing protein [Feifania hominis]|uniref:DUF3794 domain-containing protein n=1 Tax=Feifania hominis TaxID=2763660 RepID=A0A926HUV9_9FIRM|nr:SPOCS domain-containing protein [Feifania hominis]MBC8535971.1 DUF3794 domain-containing protein [Feifania hominis]
MEQNQREELKYCQTVFRGTAEASSEADIIVPDYCPDVERIVRVDASPMIRQKFAAKDKITVIGAAEVHVLYLPENGGSLRCLNHTLEFSAEFDAKGVTPESTVMADARLSYVNCHVLNSRKLTLKAGVAITVRADRVGAVPLLYPEADDSGEVCVLPEEHECDIFLGETSHEFTVAEDIEIPADKPAIATYCRSDATAMVDEYKVIDDKIVLKGHVLVDTIYVGDLESGEIVCLQSEIPFNQIVELAGITESAIAFVNLTVTGQKFDIYENDSSESRVITANIELEATVEAYCRERVALVADAYATRHECTLKNENLVMPDVLVFERVAAAVKESVQSNEELSSCIPSSCFAVVDGITKEGNTLKIAGTLHASALGKTADGVVNFDHTAPFTAAVPFERDCTSLDYSCTCSVVKFSAVMATPYSVEIRADIQCNLMLKCGQKLSFVSEIEVDESRPIADASKYLVLYYPTQGESLWDIAKRYRSSVEAMRELNHCEGDTAEQNMLMIPRRR